MDKSSHRSSDGMERQPSKSLPNRQRLQVTQLTFVNMNDCQNVATPNRITQIRSHVAKDIHARARQKRIDNLQARALPPRPKDVFKWTNAPMQKPQVARNRPREAEKDLVAPSVAASSKNDSPKETSRPATSRPFPTSSWPQAPIACGRPFAREISDTEKYMLSILIDFKESHGNPMQRAVKDHKALTKKLHATWIPYSLNKPALIDTIFLKAANALAARTASDNGRGWGLVACAYKQKCLTNAINAIERDGNYPMDETIGLVVSLAADDYIMGHWDGWVLHGKGAIELVKKRGGLQALDQCLDGLLLQMVAWSVFNPRFKIVQGPDPEELLKIPEFQPAC